MRHGDKIKNLSRKKAHRDALLANLSCQLIQHKRIVTTVTKAKALRVYVEPLITKSKDNTTHQRRIVFSYLQDKTAVTELFNNISAKVAGRPGGYTRIIKLGIRPGDAAEKALIELVDFNEIYGKGIGEEKTTGRRTRRRGGSGKKKAEGEAKTEVKAKVEDKDTPKAASAKAAKDNLLKIEGIGPKARKALSAAGINTFADLSKKSAEDLKTILTDAGGEFNLLVPDTWPQQAALAADGKWDELATLQDELKGGKAYDDLAKIEGIGPKAAEALNAGGIHSFAQLAGKTPEEIKAVLDAAENLSHLVPDTWPKQAALAADGKWDELDALQEELKGGR